MQYMLANRKQVVKDTCSVFLVTEHANCITFQICPPDAMEMDKMKTSQRKMVVSKIIVVAHMYIYIPNCYR